MQTESELGSKAWLIRTVGQATEFAEALGKEALSCIDYIEEPLQDASLLPEFCKALTCFLTIFGSIRSCCVCARTHTHTRAYLYVYVCVCVTCVCGNGLLQACSEGCSQLEHENSSPPFAHVLISTMHIM